MLIGGAWVLGQHADQRLPQFLRHLSEQFRGDIHLQGGLLGRAGKASHRLRTAVGVGNIGLDIIDGTAIHQIGPGDMDHRSLRGVQFHPFQPHAAQPDGIGPERRTGGKDPHAGIAPQTRRAHRGRPVLAHRLGKLPDEPQVGKTLQPPQGVGIAVLRLKDNGGFQLLHQAALPRDTKLGGEVAVDAGDNM